MEKTKKLSLIYLAMAMLLAVVLVLTAIWTVQGGDEVAVSAEEANVSGFINTFGTLYADTGDLASHRTASEIKNYYQTKNPGRYQDFVAVRTAEELKTKVDALVANKSGSDALGMPIAATPTVFYLVQNLDFDSVQYSIRHLPRNCVFDGNGYTVNLKMNGTPSYENTYLPSEDAEGVTFYYFSTAGFIATNAGMITNAKFDFTSNHGNSLNREDSSASAALNAGRHLSIGGAVVGINVGDYATGKGTVDGIIDNCSLTMRSNLRIYKRSGGDFDVPDNSAIAAGMAGMMRYGAQMNNCAVEMKAATSIVAIAQGKAYNGLLAARSSAAIAGGLIGNLYPSVGSEFPNTVKNCAVTSENSTPMIAAIAGKANTAANFTAGAGGVIGGSLSIGRYQMRDGTLSEGAIQTIVTNWQGTVYTNNDKEVNENAGSNADQAKNQLYGLVGLQDKTDYGSQIVGTVVLYDYGSDNGTPRAVDQHNALRQYVSVVSPSDVKVNARFGRNASAAEKLRIEMCAKGYQYNDAEPDMEKAALLDKETYRFAEGKDGSFQTGTFIWSVDTNLKDNVGMPVEPTDYLGAYVYGLTGTEYGSIKVTVGQLYEYAYEVGKTSKEYDGNPISYPQLILKQGNQSIAGEARYYRSSFVYNETGSGVDEPISAADSFMPGYYRYVNSTSYDPFGSTGAETVPLAYYDADSHSLARPHSNFANEVNYLITPGLLKYTVSDIGGSVNDYLKGARITVGFETLTKANALAGFDPNTELFDSIRYIRGNGKITELFKASTEDNTIDIIDEQSTPEEGVSYRIFAYRKGKKVASFADPITVKIDTDAPEIASIKYYEVTSNADVEITEEAIATQWYRNNIKIVISTRDALVGLSGVNMLDSTNVTTEIAQPVNGYSTVTVMIKGKADSTLQIRDQLGNISMIPVKANVDAVAPTFRLAKVLCEEELSNDKPFYSVAVPFEFSLQCGASGYRLQYAVIADADLKAGDPLHWKECDWSYESDVAQATVSPNFIIQEDMNGAHVYFRLVNRNGLYGTPAEDGSGESYVYPEADSQGKNGITVLRDGEMYDTYSLKNDGLWTFNLVYAQFTLTRANLYVDVIDEQASSKGNIVTKEISLAGMSNDEISALLSKIYNYSAEFTGSYEWPDGNPDIDDDNEFFARKIKVRIFNPGTKTLIDGTQCKTLDAGLNNGFRLATGFDENGLIVAYRYRDENAGSNDFMIAVSGNEAFSLNGKVTNYAARFRFVFADTEPACETVDLPVGVNGAQVSYATRIVPFNTGINVNKRLAQMPQISVIDDQRHINYGEALPMEFSLEWAGVTEFLFRFVYEDLDASGRLPASAVGSPYLVKAELLNGNDNIRFVITDGDLTVNKRPVAYRISVDEGNFQSKIPYDGKRHEVKAVYTDLDKNVVEAQIAFYRDADCTIRWTQTIDGKETPVTAIQDAGTYYIKVTYDQDADYTPSNLTSVFEVKVIKAKLPVTTGTVTKQYTGQPISYELTWEKGWENVAQDSKVKESFVYEYYPYEEGAKYDPNTGRVDGIVSKTPIAAADLKEIGIYAVKVRCTETDYGLAYTYPDGVLIVEKADAKLLVEPLSVTYSGEKHAFGEIGSVIRLVRADDETQIIASTLQEEIDAGALDLNQMLRKDGNSDPLFRIYYMQSISKMIEVDFDDVSNGAFQTNVKEDPLNAGKVLAYEYRVQFVGSTHYNGVANMNYQTPIYGPVAKAELLIGFADMDPSKISFEIDNQAVGSNKYQTVYDGKEHVFKAIYNGATVYYWKEGLRYDTPVGYTDAGTYSIRLTIEKENYNPIDGITLYLGIDVASVNAKFENEVRPADDEYEYDAQPHGPQLEVTPYFILENGKYYYVSGGVKSEAGVTGLQTYRNVGTYTDEITVTIKNYASVVFKNVVTVITPKKVKDAEIEKPEIGEVDTDTDFSDFTMSFTGVNGKKITLAVDFYDENGNLVTIGEDGTLAEGVYTAKPRLTNDNYTIDQSVGVTVKVKAVETIDNPSTEPEPEKKTNWGLIGGVIGGVAALIVVLAAVVVIVKKKKK